ncbi:MAG: hypothetical protein RQ754_02990 [Desulfuromonadales bacterium]|nr:hypothetical protein [Desulfuromonadales bacterium]
MKTVLRTEQDRNRLREIVGGLSLDSPKEVEIKEHKANRSVSQHRLMWVWNTVLGAELGESKEEIHERNKERFLVPIYERDDPEFAEMIEAVREVYRAGMQEKAQMLFRRIVKLTSTTTANVKQMTEYLDEIEKDAMNLNIYLPHPEDLYREAFGRAA